MSHYENQDSFYDPLMVQQWSDHHFRGTDNNTTMNETSVDDMIAFPFQKDFRDGVWGATNDFGDPFAGTRSPTLSTSSSHISLGTPNLPSDVSSQNDARFIHRHSQSVPIDKMTLLSLGLGSRSSFESPSPVYENAIQQELMDVDLASSVATIRADGDPAGGTINPKALVNQQQSTQYTELPSNHIENTSLSNKYNAQNYETEKPRPEILRHSTNMSATSGETLSQVQDLPSNMTSIPQLPNQGAGKPVLDFKMNECYNAITYWEQNDNAVDESPIVGNEVFTFDSAKPRSQSYSYDWRKRNTRMFNFNMADAVSNDLLGGFMNTDKKRRKSMKDETPQLGVSVKITKNRSRSGSTSSVRNRSNSIHKIEGSLASSPAKTGAIHPNIDGSFQCSECDKSFKRSEHLKRHIRSVHSKERPYACEYCDKRFSRTDNLAQHNKTHKKDSTKRLK